MSDSHATTGESPLAAIRDSARRFVAQHSSLRRVRDQRGVVPGYAPGVWRAMAEAGWFGVMVAEDAGGMGLGLPEAVALTDVLATAAFPEPFVACALLPSLLLAGHDLLPEMVAGTIMTAVAWQEDANRWDPAHCATTVMLGAQAELSGTKRFVAGAAGADGFLVSAREPAGLSVWWVPADTKGVTLTLDRLADGTFAGTLRLSGARVPRANRVCDGATLARALDVATILTGAELLACARAGFEMTLEHLRTRRQFDRPIGAFQALRHRAVDCGAQLELAGGVLADATTTTDPAEHAALASRVKASCGDAAWLIAREGIQMFGAMGFTDELDLSLYVKRIVVLSAALGSADHHRRRFAKLRPPPAEARGMRVTIAPGLRALSRDTDWNALPDADFRLLVRDFFEREYPDEYRHLPRRVRWAEVREFNLKLVERGWIAPAWPRAQGGMALSPAKQIIYAEELEHAGVGRAPDQGVRQVGPVIMRYGTEAQKAHYLPRILSCEHIWCQGYSEPGAGSDLASVTTKAERDGDHFVINGQKI